MSKDVVGLSTNVHVAWIGDGSDFSHRYAREADVDANRESERSQGSRLLTDVNIADAVAQRRADSLGHGIGYTANNGIVAKVEAHRLLTKPNLSVAVEGGGRA